MRTTPRKTQPTMSLRDWFASQVVMAMASQVGLRHSTATAYEATQLAQRAYEIADAMMVLRRHEAGKP